MSPGTKSNTSDKEVASFLIQIFRNIDTLGPSGHIHLISQNQIPDTDKSHYASPQRNLLVEAILVRGTDKSQLTIW
jgi:hypothetical protein